MKKILFTIAISSLFIACGSDKTENEEEITTENPTESAIDLSELREFPLTDYELDAVMYVPKNHFMVSDEEEGLEEPKVIHNEGEAKWNISMRSNKNWNITIEDWGDEKKSIALEKEIHLETSEVYDYNYLEEGSDYLLFQRQLKSGSTTMDEETASKLPNFHFVVVKNIGDTYFTIKSNDLGEFRKISAEKMLNAARAFK